MGKTYAITSEEMNEIKEYRRTIKTRILINGYMRFNYEEKA